MQTFPIRCRCRMTSDAIARNHEATMPKSTISGSSGKKYGRPALYEGSESKGAPRIGLRLPPNELEAVDSWIAKQQKPLPSRPLAIRRLVELGQKTAPPTIEQINEAKSHAARAAKLAAELGLKIKK